jgi:methionine-rich copper-binding protein CopC
MTPNRGAVATSVVVLLLVVGAVTLMAHMRVQKTMPEDGAVLSGAPSRVQVWYTQAPDPAISQLLLEGADGAVALDETAIGDDKSLMAVLPTSLAGGIYTVKWRTAGDDGHTQRGDFSFTVRAAN